MFDKAWTMQRPNFERVPIPWEGKMLRGFFRKPGGPAGTTFPVVIGFQGADSMAHNTISRREGPRAERPQTLQDWMMRPLHADVQRS